LGWQGGNLRLWGPERFFSVFRNAECTYPLSARAEFHRTTVTSDADLPACRQFHDPLGLATRVLQANTLLFLCLMRHGVLNFSEGFEIEMKFWYYRA